jgi:hypothetical protein
MIWGFVILRQTFVRRSQNCVASAATAGGRIRVLKRINSAD